MGWADHHLLATVKEIDAGENPTLTVRDFLWWWYAQRRTYSAVQVIRDDLKRFGLETIPDFEGTYLDSEIVLRRVVVVEPVKADDQQNGSEQFDGIFANTDPTYRVGKLAAANQTVFFVNPDSSLEEIVTIMMEKDFSQIPVMTSDREVKGIVTWSSIGSRLALKRKHKFAREFMDGARIVNYNDSMFDVIDQIVDFDHVLVRGEENRITGIITASDLSIQFRHLSEAFLILSEIENHIRSLIEPKFSKEDLAACIDPGGNQREVDGVADLSF